MKMNKILNGFEDWAILISRLIIGGVFIYSGWMKVVDMPSTIGFFSTMHIPAFLAYIVAYGELIGGVLVLLGLWLEYATLFLMIVMSVAIYLTHGAGFTMFGLPLSVLGGLLAIFAKGSGKYSLKPFIYSSN